MPDDKTLLTIGEAARQLGVTPGTIRRWDQDGGIIHIHRTPGNQRRIPQSEVDRILGA